MKKRTSKLYRYISVTLAICIAIALWSTPSPAASAENRELKVFDSSLFDTVPINGLRESFVLPAGAETLLDQGRMTPFFTKTYNVGDTEVIKNLDDIRYLESRTVRLAAVSAHSQVWVDINDINYSHFAPTGSTPHANATEIAGEFEFIYGLVTGKIGEPNYIDGTSKKINIVLCDIDGDGGSASTYIAGFFNPNDYLPGYGNDDTFIYIDIGTNQGYGKFSDSVKSQGWTSFFGTIAHELQHLINFSCFLQNFTNEELVFPMDGTDPDWPGNDSTGQPYVSNVTTWYDEGLSGLIDVLYQNQKGWAMEKTYLDHFLSRDVSPYSGFVPNRNQWYDTSDNPSTSEQILTLYGASAAMMQEYYAKTGDASYLVSNPRVGYNPYSFMNVAYGYGLDDSVAGFDEFFTIANLNIQVDSPSAPAAPYVYYTSDLTGAENTWEYKTRYNISDTIIYAGSSVPFSTGGRTYMTQTYVSASAQATGYVSVETPSDGEAEYYIITAYETTNASTRAGGWDAAPKIAQKLAPGNNLNISVGKDNLFAVLAVAHGTAVAESFSFTAASGKPGDVNNDGKVDATDLSMLISDFGKTGAAITHEGSDVNGDNKVDATDLSMLIANFG